MEQQLKRTPLYNQHVSLKAKMVPFGGWDMPVQYKSILEEYDQTRRSAAIFDICHMGEFLIEGDAVKSGLDFIVTQKLIDMPVKTSRYGMALNSKAGVLDDLIVFRIAQDKWFVVVNAATKEGDAAHFQKHLTKEAKFTDLSDVTGKIDLQGPLSRDVLAKLVPEIAALEYFTFDYFTLLGEKNILISRTGYTGELGYEIYFPWNKIHLLWEAFLKDERVQPAGLGARDILRLEVGYSLYGHELREDKNPIQSGLTRFIDFDKEFMGKDVLLEIKQQGVKEKIVGLLSHDRRSPRAGQKIFSESGEVIGEVTSGSFSPALTKGIGLGFVNVPFAANGTIIYFGEKPSSNRAVIASRIFLKETSLKR